MQYLLFTELIRDMLRCVWIQDSSILRIVLPFLHTASAKFHYATDVLFMEVMPVSPSFCRWVSVVYSLLNLLACGGIHPGRVESASPIELTTSRTETPQA